MFSKGADFKPLETKIVNTNLQCLQRSLEKVAIESRWSGATIALDCFQFLEQIVLTGCQYASDDISMPTQVFGRRVHHKIGAKF